MKRIFVLIFLAFSIVPAQQKLNVMLKVSVTDSGKTVIQNFTSQINETISRYFYRNNEFTILEKTNGSFSFIRDIGGLNAFDSRTEIYKNSLTDILIMPSANLSPYFDELIDISITPCPLTNTKDSLALYTKYVKHDRVDSSGDYDFTTRNRFGSKIVKVPLNKEIELNDYSAVFKGYKFYIKLSDGSGNNTLDAGMYDETLCRELLNSIKESKIKNTCFEFEVNYNNAPISSAILAPKMTGAFNIMLRNIDIPRIQSIVLNNEPRNAELEKIIRNSGIKEKKINGEKLIDLGAKSIYYVKFDFPFDIKDSGKKNMYKKYSTYEKILKSTYEIIIVPISFVNDELTIDVFVKWEKLNIGDFIQRWTPIKKRIVINYADSRNVFFNLPKEKWTANFTREGTQYDISGYYEYEKFIDETINISFKKINKEKIK